MDVFYCQLVGCCFVLSCENNVFYTFFICIFELFAEFGGIGVDFAGVACGPATGSGVQNIGQGSGAHVGEEVFGTAYCILGEFVQTDQYVIDTVRSEGYADSLPMVKSRALTSKMAPV